jgi:hypothetical protein
MRVLVAAMIALGALPARAATEDTWLGGLTERVVADLAAGKPLVIEVHVPL